MIFSPQQNEYKILFTGPMGAGKTTAISTISDIVPVTTEVANSTTGGHGKATTTVGLDYGEVVLEGGERLRLYGTPGQDRFSPIWEILTYGAMGVIILIDHSTPDSYQRLDYFLNAFREVILSTSGVVGLTRVDLAPNRDMDPYFECMIRHSMMLPVFPVDARTIEDIRILLDALFSVLESRLMEANESAS